MTQIVEIRRIGQWQADTNSLNLDKQSFPGARGFANTGGQLT